MRRSLFVAALLCSTALTPTRAEALPVFGFIAGSLGVAATATIASTAAYAAGTAFAATALGSFAVQAVVSIGLSAITGALFGPNIPPPSARMVSFAQPISYMETVYGRTRKSGPLGFTGFNNSRRYYVPILAAHPIEGIVEHWLDERVITLSSETDNNVSNVTTAPVASYVRVDPFTGGAAQAANAGLVSAFTEVTSAYNFKGLAGAVCWAARPPQASFSEIYPSGRQPSYSPVIQGKKDIYDPRTDGNGYTNNAALVLADWIVNGLGRAVDWDEVSDEADICDQTVTNKEGDTQARWTLNGTISDDQEFNQVRAQMAAACDAFIYERTDGKVGFTVGRWIAPTVTLTAADFYSLSITEGQWGADAPDEIAAKYVEPDNSWRETSSGVHVINAGAVPPVRDEPSLFMCNSHNQAARVMKRLGKARRPKYRIQGSIGLMGYELIGHRFIRILHPEMGFDETVEIGELSREGVANFSLSAVSAQASDFDFDASTEEPTKPILNQVLSDSSIPVPANLSFTAQEGGGVLAAWDAQEPGYTQEIRYRKVGDTAWLTARTSESATSLLLSGMTDATNGEGQIRNVTAGVGVGPYGPDPAATFSTVFNSTPPAAIVSISLSRIGSDVTISFVPPNDANYASALVYHNTTNNFGTATEIGRVYPAGGNSLVHSADDGANYYWVVSENQSFVVGTTTGPETISVSP